MSATGMQCRRGLRRSRCSVGASSVAEAPDDDAQTIWYMPTALDIWSQKLVKAPGHYARGFAASAGAPPAPVVYWADQEPRKELGPLRERLGHWLTLVHRGQVIDAYRIFLGLVDEPEHRREVLAELVFAGLIDL